jgi:hypothetical protein
MYMIVWFKPFSAPRYGEEPPLRWASTTPAASVQQCLFGYLAIVENAIRGLRPNWSPWLLGDNIILVITNQTQNTPLVGRSTLEASTLVACYTLALLAAALFAFHRRDIA